MPILSLTAVARDTVRLRDEIPPDDPALADLGLALSRPLRIDVEASTVGEGVLVRGEMETELAGECRRCLVSVPIEVKDSLELLFEPLTEEEEVELSGEVYPLPDRSDKLDLRFALREQLLLKVPDFVVCSETCRGLCAQCGAELNRTTCECVPEKAPGPWDALKNVEFD